MIWLAVLLTASGCYALKLTGWLVPLRRGTHLVELLPVALLSALVVVQALADGRSLVLDARAAGLAVAAVALWRRAPFLVVVLSAAATAALLRAV